MAVAKSKAELDRDIEEANRAKNPGDGDVGDRSQNPNRAKSTTASVSQSAEEASRDQGGDTSQPKRGDGTYPPSGATPTGLPDYDQAGNRIR